MKRDDSGEVLRAVKSCPPRAAQAIVTLAAAIEQVAELYPDELYALTGYLFGLALSNFERAGLTEADVHAQLAIVWSKLAEVDANADAIQAAIRDVAKGAQS